MTLVVSTTSANGKSFLQLVAQLRQECGVSGAAPVTTVNQIAEINRLVGWIQQAWIDIQELRQDWLFMRDQVSFQVTPASGGSYTPAQVGEPNLSGYKRDSFRAYPVSVGVVGEQILPFEAYDSFRNLYLFGANRSQLSRPVMFTVDPAKNFVVGPLPNEPYIIDGEVFAQPQEFASDTDVPRMPSQFHMLIVYKAMQKYGMYENAPEVVSRGEMEYSAMLRRLLIDQTPTIGFAGCLA